MQSDLWTLEVYVISIYLYNFGTTLIRHCQAAVYLERAIIFSDNVSKTDICPELRLVPFPLISSEITDLTADK